MLSRRSVIAVAFAASLSIGWTSITSAAQAPSPDVDQLLRQIKGTLIRVQKEIIADKLPPLKSVQINLQTAIKMTGGGKISFFVISLGDTVSAERAQTIKITLKPPKVTSTNVSSTGEFSEELAAAIIAVAETIARSSAQKPALELTDLSASIKFTSESTVEGGITKVQLLPISIDLGGKITPANTHEALIQFGAAKNSDD